MTAEYRHPREDERRAFVYAGNVGFGARTGDADVDRGLARSFGMRLEAHLGAFEDGQLVSQIATFPFAMRWNGRDVACGGVTSVSTLPTHRRRGHVRELMLRSFCQMREEGVPVAMLWASMAAIYQRFGYGLGYLNWTYEFDPRHLRFVDRVDTPGRLRLLRPDEALPVISACYNRYADQRTLMLRRGTPGLEDWWTRMVVGPGYMADSPAKLVVVYEEGTPGSPEQAEVLGYAIYDVEQRHSASPGPAGPGGPAGPNEVVNVKELVALSLPAHRALIQCLAGYDLAGAVRIIRQPVDDPLFYQVQEARLLNTRTEDGTWVRIVDAKAALEARGYDADGRLTFALDDDLCPWNSGTWELSVEGGTGRVRPGSREPQLVVSMRALAVLASGCQDATTLARLGLLCAAEPGALAVADAIFRTTYAPLCVDVF